VTAREREKRERGGQRDVSTREKREKKREKERKRNDKKEERACGVKRE